MQNAGGHCRVGTSAARRRPASPASSITAESRGRRRVSVAGTVTVLSQSFRAGKRHRGLYLRLAVDTGRWCLTAYLNGRVLKRRPYKLLND
jgi:hypothetical protein